MLQDIREKSKGWIQYLIIGLIALTFLIIGTGSFTLNQNKQVLAKVNSSEITQRDVDNLAERLRLMQGEQGQNLDQKILSIMALNSLIQDKAMMSASTKRGFIISKDQILSAINSDPAFAQDGKFSVDRYRNLLSQNRYTDLEYREFVASRFVYTQLTQGLTLTNFALEDDIKTLFKFIDQQRDIEYAVLRHEDFIDKVEITDTLLQNEYNENQQAYMSPELVKIAYLELSEDGLKSELQYTDEDINAYYLDQIQTFTDPDKYKVAHILAEFSDDDEQAARQKIEEVQAKLAKGESFAELAKQYSDDPVSAKKGGELLWIIKGEVGVDLDFDEAVYKLQKPGDRTEIVKSRFGFHIIELLEKEDARVAPLAEVKDKVVDMYLSHKAQDLLFDKADDLTSITYEYSDNLEEAADALGLKVKTTELFGRNGGDDTLTQNQKVIQAAFSESVLLDKHNSDLIELGKHHFMVLRVVEHLESELMPFKQVEAKIRKKLTKQAASDMADKHAKDTIAQINEKDLASVKADSKFNWKKSKNLSRTDAGLELAIVNKTFEIPRTNINQADIAALKDGDFAVVVLTGVKDGDIEGVEKERLAALKQSYSQFMGEQDFHLYAQEAKSQVKIVKNED